MTDIGNLDEIRANIKSLLEERKYWTELADLLGWKVRSWTYKHYGSYWDKTGNNVELTGSQRDDIVKAIKARTDINILNDILKRFLERNV